MLGTPGMQSMDPVISACRHCRFYQAEGRRGGQCHLLGVPVRSTWNACSQAVSPFVAVPIGIEQLVSYSIEVMANTVDPRLPVSASPYPTPAYQTVEVVSSL